MYAPYSSTPVAGAPYAPSSSGSGNAQAGAPPAPGSRAGIAPPPAVPGSRTAQHTQNADQVAPRIWVGDAKSAADANFLHTAGIGAILNCTKDIPNYFGGRGDLEYMRVPVNDSLQKVDIDRMREFLPHAASFVYKNRDLEGKNVLIHCAAGIQRSATCAAFFLHLYEDLPLTQAIEQILRARPKAFHNGTHLNFRESLQRQQRF